MKYDVSIRKLIVCKHEHVHLTGLLNNQNLRVCSYETAQSQGCSRSQEVTNFNCCGTKRILHARRLKEESEQFYSSFIS